MTDDKQVQTAIARLALRGVTTLEVPGTGRFIISRAGEHWTLDDAQQLLEFVEFACRPLAPPRIDAKMLADV